MPGHSAPPGANNGNSEKKQKIDHQSEQVNNEKYEQLMNKLNQQQAQIEELMRINKLYEEKEARSKLETENATNLLLGIGKRKDDSMHTQQKVNRSYAEITNNNQTEAKKPHNTAQGNSKLETANITTIKFKGNHVHNYKNYFKLSKEIKRCKNVNISSAYVNSYDELIIKTREEAASLELSKPWPKDAFHSGITLIPKINRYFVAINNVELDIDIEDQDTLEYFHTEYKISKIIRIKKKSSNTETKTLRLETNCKINHEKLLNTGIIIGSTYFRAREWKFQERIQQCHKCQRYGHIQAKCKETKQTCLRCAQTHDFPYSECNNTIKCSNCSGNHPSCSKSCPKVEEYKKHQTEKKSKHIVPNKQQNTQTNINKTEGKEEENKNIINLIHSTTFSQNVLIIKFIIEVLTNINELAGSIHENPEIMVKTISKIFGHHIASLFELSIKKNIVDYQNTSTNSEIYIDEDDE